MRLPCLQPALPINTTGSENTAVYPADHETEIIAAPKITGDTSSNNYEIEISTALIANTVVAVVGDAAIVVSDDDRTSGMHGAGKVIAIDLNTGHEIFNVDLSIYACTLIVSNDDFEHDSLVWICIDKGRGKFIQCVSVRSGEILWSNTLTTEGYYLLYYRNGMIVLADMIRAQFLDPLSGELIKEMPYDEASYLAEGWWSIVKMVKRFNSKWTCKSQYNELTPLRHYYDFNKGEFTLVERSSGKILQSISLDAETDLGFYDIGYVYAVTELSNGTMLNIAGSSELRAALFSDKLMRVVLLGDVSAAEFGEDVFYVATETHITAYKLQTSEIIWERLFSDLMSVGYAGEIMIHKNSIYLLGGPGVIELDLASGEFLSCIQYDYSRGIFRKCRASDASESRAKMTYHGDFAFIPKPYGLTIIRK